MSNTRLSTQPHRCHSVRRSISIHILRNLYCCTNRKCLLSSSTDNIKICLLHVPRKHTQGICAESVLLQFTLTSVIYFTFKNYLSYSFQIFVLLFFVFSLLSHSLFHSEGTHQVTTQFRKLIQQTNKKRSFHFNHNVVTSTINAGQMRYSSNTKST